MTEETSLTAEERSSMAEKTSLTAEEPSSMAEETSLTDAFLTNQFLSDSLKYLPCFLSSLSENLYLGVLILLLV